MPHKLGGRREGGGRREAGGGRRDEGGGRREDGGERRRGLAGQILGKAFSVHECKFA